MDVIAQADTSTHITQILAANPDKVSAYRNGKEGLLGFFVGQVMKATQGKAPGTIDPLQ